mgnify:CR=1 FL=1
MNVPSTQFIVEIAKIGGQYVARCSYSQGPGSIGGVDEDILISAGELQKWLIRAIQERVK